MPDSQQRVAASDTIKTIRTTMQAGPATARPHGTGITLHCTVPYEGAGPEDIVHRFDDGTIITEARDLPNSQRVFYYYSGGQSTSDPLVNEGVIGTHPASLGSLDPDYMQITNDMSIAVRFKPGSPNETEFAVLNLTHSAVTHSAYSSLISHAPTVGNFDQIVVLNPTTLLLVRVGNFGLNLQTCVVTRSGTSLTAGPVQSQASGFNDLGPNLYKVVRINDTTAYLVAPDFEPEIEPFNERMVKGLTLTVSGTSTTLGPIHSMHPSTLHWAQISPTPSGVVVVGTETGQPLAGLFGPFLKYSVWAVNPLTGVSGPQVHLDYEMTGTSGFMQPTGQRQASAIWHGISPADQDEEPGTEEAIWGLVVDVAADLTVTPNVNRVSPPGMSDFDFMNAGHGTDVGMVNMWHDRTRARGHLYGDAQSWFGGFGGVTHYIVGNQVSYGPSTVGGIEQRVAPRKGG